MTLLQFVLLLAACIMIYVLRKMREAPVQPAREYPGFYDNLVWADAGRAMYVIYGDEVHRYTLSQPYAWETAVLDPVIVKSVTPVTDVSFNAAGTELKVMTRDGERVYQLSCAWDITSLPDVQMRELADMNAIDLHQGP